MQLAVIVRKLNKFKGAFWLKKYSRLEKNITILKKFFDCSKLFLFLSKNVQIFSKIVDFKESKNQSFLKLLKTFYV